MKTIISNYHISKYTTGHDLKDMSIDKFEAEIEWNILQSHDINKINFGIEVRSIKGTFNYTDCRNNSPRRDSNPEYDVETEIEMEIDSKYFEIINEMMFEDIHLNHPTSLSFDFQNNTITISNED